MQPGTNGDLLTVDSLLKMDIYLKIKKKPQKLSTLRVW